MQQFQCPICGQQLLRHQRKDQSQFFWSCSTDSCDFICDDYNNEPFIKKCPECGHFLNRKISPKTQRPYVACFNKDGHSDHETLFFSQDGDEVVKKLVAKGTFYCPECHGELLYRRVTKGNAKGKTVFLCKNAHAHMSGKSNFFGDNDGEPIFPR